MTNIKQFFQTSPSKANELLAKLVDTSDTAIKTRERLFEELKSELEILARLEEKHLFPVLRKHKETKDLVSDALNDNRQTLELLAELERVPRGSPEFAPKVAELRKVFQQSIRDEQKELLPAILTALSDEEAQAIIEKFEDGKADVEGAKRAEAEQHRAEQRQEREQAESRLAEQREADDREQQTRKSALRTADEVAQSSRQVIQSGAEVAQRVAAAPMSTGSLFWDAMFGVWMLPHGRSVSGATDIRTSSLEPRSQQEEVIPLAEETLIVGKQTVNRGTTRVRRYIVESPAEQEVTLYNERVVVERRRPVTDASTGETLTELTVEMIETSEVPLVAKGVRVREEVVVRRERTKRVETVRDTIRREEVEISTANERTGNRRVVALSRK